MSTNNIKGLIISIIALFSIFDISAKKKIEYPRAEIKVGYNYHKKQVNGSEGIVEKDIPFILLANSEESKFFNARTEYKDSLNSSSSGRKLASNLFKVAFNKYF